MEKFRVTFINVSNDNSRFPKGKKCTIVISTDRTKQDLSNLMKSNGESVLSMNRYESPTDKMKAVFSANGISINELYEYDTDYWREPCGPDNYLNRLRAKLGIN